MNSFRAVALRFIRAQVSRAATVDLRDEVDALAFGFEAVLEE